MKRKKYSNAVKEVIAVIYLNSNLSANEISTITGISCNSINRWAKEYKEKNSDCKHG